MLAGTSLGVNEFRRLRGYAFMLHGATWFTLEQADDFCGLVDRLAEARPEESGTPGPRSPQFWIYPGERRPVIVEAPDATTASAKVQRSPMYDGFGWRVYPVEEFAQMCEEGTAP